MEIKIYKQGEVIFREGEYQTWMYGICEGSVDILTGWGTPEERKLTTLTAGQFFGEIGMIAMVPRTATALAAGEVRLELVPYEDLKEYLIAHPENLQKLMHNVSGRLRELTGDLALVNRGIQEARARRKSGTATSAWLSRCLKDLTDVLRKNRFTEEAAPAVSREKRILAKEYPPVGKYRDKEVIFREGDESGCMYEILSGSVGIYSNYGKPEQKLLATLTREQLFGEMGVLDQLPRSATAVSQGESCLTMVDRAHFMDYFQGKPMKMLQLLQQMSMQLRSLTKEYLQVCRVLEELLQQTQQDDSAVWETLEALSDKSIIRRFYEDRPSLDGIFY